VTTLKSYSLLAQWPGADSSLVSRM